MPAWDDDIERVFTFSNERIGAGWEEGSFRRDGPIREIDDARLADMDFSEDQLRELFDMGFTTRTGEIPSGMRWDLRQQYFDAMEFLGYDRTQFDWYAWREWMGYE